MQTCMYGTGLRYEVPPRILSSHELRLPVVLYTEA